MFLWALMVVGFTLPHPGKRGINIAPMIYMGWSTLRAIYCLGDPTACSSCLSVLNYSTNVSRYVRPTLCVLLYTTEISDLQKKKALLTNLMTSPTMIAAKILKKQHMRLYRQITREEGYVVPNQGALAIAMGCVPMPQRCVSLRG